MEYNGPEGIMVCKPKQDVVEELEKRISKDGMAYIPENVYESINYCLTHLFGSGNPHSIILVSIISLVRYDCISISSYSSPF